MANFSWEDIIAQIDELVMDAVESNTADLGTVIKLHDKLLEITETTAETKYPGIAKIAQKAGELAMTIVLQEATEPEKVLDLVIEASSCLQCMVREIIRGGSPLYVPIPDGLQLQSDILFGAGKTSANLPTPNEPSKVPNEADNKIISPTIPQTNKPSTATQPPHTIVNNTEPAPTYPEFQMGSLTESHLTDFLNELYELVQKAEGILLNLEKNGQQNSQMIQDLFGVFHTIKGISGIMKLQKIIELAHKAEVLLEKVSVLEPNIIHILFQCIDIFKAYGNSLQHYHETKHFLIVPEIQPLISLLDNFHKQIDANLISAEPEKGSAKISAEIAKNTAILPIVPKNTPDINFTPTVSSSNLQPTTTQVAEMAAQVLSEMTIKKQAELNADSLLQTNSANNEENKPVTTHTFASAKDTVGASYILDSIKITTSRLDMLVDTVGELVISQSMLENNQEITGLKKSETLRNLANIRKITRELQELAMSMRMVTIQSTFQAMERLIRDLAYNQGKTVEVLINGEHTEMDRNIIDSIYNPLIHLVRNAISHGIELPTVRQNKGKPSKGKIEFNAYHRGGNIVIEIRDDGQGLQRDKILQKAIQQGILDSKIVYSDDMIYQTIFLPNFSTAETIDEISGRGVGLDVVKKNIEKLRGRVEVSTEIGKGTTFRLTVPLTLAIIEGMLVRIRNEKYIIPLIHIEEFVQTHPNQLSHIGQQGTLLLLRGSTLPVLNLEQLLYPSPSVQANIEQNKFVGVIVISEGKRYCLLVEELLGQQQVVIKSLGTDFQNLIGISGAAILGDGKIGLILDIQDILHRGYAVK